MTEMMMVVSMDVMVSHHRGEQLRLVVVGVRVRVVHA